MATLRDFVPENVAISWGGIALHGFAPDTFITARRNADNTAASVGADGSVGITKIADKTGTIEITLMQTAESHLFLSAVQNTQDYDKELWRANMSISDPSGGFLCLAKNVHIMSPPEVSLGSDQNEKTWTFFVEELIFTETPAAYSATAGQAARIADAVSGLKEVSDKLNDAIGG